MENFVAFRARSKSMFSAKLRLRPEASLVGPINQQESSSSPSLEILAAKWQRGERRSLFTQRSFDTSELEDLEQTFRKMDKEDLEKEMHESNLGMEMHKYDLENVMQPRSQLKHGELFVSVKVSDAHETVIVPVEKQANVGELAPEPFNSQKWDLLSPKTGGLGIEDGGANVDLATPLPNDPIEKLRLDQEVPMPQATPVILELGVSPGTTADNVLRTPAMSMDHLDRVTPFNVSRALSPLRSSEFVLNGPAKNLVESYEGGFLSTSLPSSSGGGMNGKVGDAEIADGRLSTCPDHTTSNEFGAHVPFTENDQDMQALKDSEATLRNSRPSWPDQSPLIPIDLSAQRMGDLHEKTSETSLEPLSLQLAEPLRRVDDVTAIPFLEQTSFDTIRTSPTPPRNISLFFGNAFGQMNGEELSRRWLQFCITPPVFSDATVGKKKSWNVEAAFAEPTCSDLTASFPSEQVLQRTTEADVLLIAEEEAVSSDDLGGKTSMHDEGVLPNAEEEALSSDGSDGVIVHENEFDDISNDTTCIDQTGASSADNEQEGTSALKESLQEDAQVELFGEDMPCANLTPLRDNNSVETTAGPAVEYSLTHIDDEHIDQFMNSLQVTLGVDDSCVERPISNAEGVSRDATVIHNCQSPDDEAGQLNLNKELITPERDGNRHPAQAQDECTPVQQKPKTKRTRNSTRLKKVDSPLDPGSKWSNGQRMSTRIRSKPLDWWRGERMLYGRVHFTLNTLIGIKHLSPDPVWPRPRDRKTKVEPPKFRVDSFVSDEHKELLRLAAQ